MARSAVVRMDELGTPRARKAKAIAACGSGVAAQPVGRRTVAVRRQLDRRILLLGLMLSVAVHAVALAMIQVEPLELGTWSAAQTARAIELPTLRAIDLEPARANVMAEEREVSDPVDVIPPVEALWPEIAVIDPPAVAPLAVAATRESTVADSVLASAADAAPVLDSLEQGEYEQQVARWVERRREYPLAARHRRLEGTAIVRIQVDGDGSLLEALLVRDTGHAVLDRAALEMIRRAAPYPRVPRSLTSSTVEVLVPIQFTLSR